MNWGGHDAVSIEEWCAYFGELTGIEPQFFPTDMTLQSVSIDVTKMEELVGKPSIGWKDGWRRIVAAHYPDLLEVRRVAQLQRVFAVGRRARERVGHEWRHRRVAQRAEHEVGRERLPEPVAPQHRVPFAFDFDAAHALGDVARPARVLERAAWARRAVERAVGDHDRAIRELVDGLAVGKPRRERGDRAHRRVTGDAQCGAPAERVPDQHHRHVAVARAYLVECPPRVGQRRHLVAVPSAHAVAQDPHREPVVASLGFDVPRERAHPAHGQLVRRGGCVALVAAAVQQQRDRVDR